MLLESAMEEDSLEDLEDDASLLDSVEVRFSSSEIVEAFSGYSSSPSLGGVSGRDSPSPWNIKR